MRVWNQNKDTRGKPGKSGNPFENPGVENKQKPKELRSFPH